MRNDSFVLPFREKEVPLQTKRQEIFSIIITVIINEIGETLISECAIYYYVANDYDIFNNIITT